MGASTNAGEPRMTISLVMGPNRPKRQDGRKFRRPEGIRQDEGQGPAKYGQPDEDGPDEGPELRVPSMHTPENDVALARMLGCAFLIGISSIVGLLVLVF